MLFDVYRRLLFIAVSVYVLVRTILFFARLSAAMHSPDRSEAMMHRYLVTVLFRVRARGFWFEFLQIVALTVVLLGLLQWHRVAEWSRVLG